MFDFDLSKARVVPEATRDYRLPDTGITLKVIGLGPANAAYQSESMTRRAAFVAAGLNDDILSSADTLAAHWRRQAPMVAKHALRGWSGVVNGAGAAVPFSTEAATELLEQLAGDPTLVHLFTDLWTFVNEPSNFNAGVHAATAQALSGNLSGG